MKKFGSRIRVGKKSDSGSGINIPDPQHCISVVQYLLKGQPVNSYWYQTVKKQTGHGPSNPDPAAKYLYW
jgi:hypothetical protein